MKTVTIKVTAKDIGTRMEHRNGPLEDCMVARALRRRGFKDASVTIHHAYIGEGRADITLPSIVAHTIQQWCDWRDKNGSKPKPFSFKLQVP